jgi:hypothetical protein
MLEVIARAVERAHAERGRDIVRRRRGGRARPEHDDDGADQRRDPRCAYRAIPS